MRRRVIVLVASLAAGCGLTVRGLATAPDDDAGTPAASASTTSSAPATTSSALPEAAAPDANIVDAGPIGAGTALSFNGMGQIVGVTRPVKDDFTLEAWIHTTDSGGTGKDFFNGPPVWHCDTSGENNDFGSSILNKKFAFGTGMPNTTIVSASDVATGAWVHVAAVRVKSTGTITLFVNGVQEATATKLNTNSLDSNPELNLGANVLNSIFFNGLMDEVRAWGIARTGTEIQSTMRMRLRGDETGLVGYWRFDDGMGMTAIDSTSSHDNGVLGDGDASAAPAWVPSTAF